MPYISTLYSDTLQDTDGVTLQAHAPVGSPTAFTWAKYGPGTTNLIFASNKLVRDVSGNGSPGYYKASFVPPTNYKAGMYIRPTQTGTVSTFGGLRVRIDTVNGGFGVPEGGYLFVLDTSSSTRKWKLLGWDRSGFTTFATQEAVVDPLLYNTDVLVELLVANDPGSGHPVLTGFINGIATLTATDLTNQNMSGPAGIMGGWFGSDVGDRLLGGFAINGFVATQAPASTIVLDRRLEAQTGVFA